MDFDMCLEFFGVKFAPLSPTLFRGERAFLGGRQIAVNRASPQFKPPGSLSLGTARVEEFDHPLPQVQRIGFHGHNPIRLCANVNMKCYSAAPVDGHGPMNHDVALIIFATQAWKVEGAIDSLAGKAISCTDDWFRWHRAD